MPDNVREEFIRKYYNGDASAYDKNMETDDAEADRLFFTYGNRPTTHWSDIELHTKCNPEYEELALAWIRNTLGYLPEPHAYMPYLSFLQTLMENSETGKIKEDEFWNELLFYVKKVRNEDMKRGGWVRHTTYTERHLINYDKHLSVYKQLARERLCRTLNFEPLLEHSLDAEIFLRQLFGQEFFYSSMPFHWMDFKAAHIVLYRKAFLEKGEEYADDSLLIKPAPCPLMSV